jgi:nucleotidyltransferase substrate binding protein (TIGR01987 family)
MADQADKLASQFELLKRAVSRFDEVLALSPDELGTVRDSAIQRFEFCVDLSWKTLKTFLELHHGIQCASPKGCLREAAHVDILNADDDYWLTLLEFRNLSAHTYWEETAQKLYEELPNAQARFHELLATVRQKMTSVT